MMSMSDYVYRIAYPHPRTLRHLILSSAPVVAASYQVQQTWLGGVFDKEHATQGKCQNKLKQSGHVGSTMWGQAIDLNQ